MALQTLNEKFNEDEWKELQEIKKRAGMIWHDFILSAVRSFDYGDGGK